MDRVWQYHVGSTLPSQQLMNQSEFMVLRYHPKSDGLGKFGMISQLNELQSDHLLHLNDISGYISLVWNTAFAILNKTIFSNHWYFNWHQDSAPTWFVFYMVDILVDILSPNRSHKSSFMTRWKIHLGTDGLYYVCHLFSYIFLCLCVKDIKDRHEKRCEPENLVRGHIWPKMWTFLIKTTIHKDVDKRKSQIN